MDRREIQSNISFLLLFHIFLKILSRTNFYISKIKYLKNKKEIHFSWENPLNRANMLFLIKQQYFYLGGITQIPG